MWNVNMLANNNDNHESILPKPMCYNHLQLAGTAYLNNRQKFIWWSWKRCKLKPTNLLAIRKLNGFSSQQNFCSFRRKVFPCHEKILYTLCRNAYSKLTLITLTGLPTTKHRSRDYSIPIYHSMIVPINQTSLKQNWQSTNFMFAQKTIYNQSTNNNSLDITMYLRFSFSTKYTNYATTI